MAKNNIQCSAMAGWFPPVSATGLFVAPPAIEPMEHQLPGRPVGSQKNPSLESNS